MVAQTWPDLLEPHDELHHPAAIADADPENPEL
jgi:hypothetical protein